MRISWKHCCEALVIRLFLTVSMNDSLRLIDVKEAKWIFSRGFLKVQLSDLGALLLYTLNMKTEYTVCFFVALLKFPPIVQSGLILFRNWTRCGRSLTQGPPFSVRSLVVVLMCGQWHHSFYREWQAYLQLFWLKIPSSETDVSCIYCLCPCQNIGLV